MQRINIIKERILQSKLLKDSFWALIGNGVGDFLLLVSGILIARFLGRDLYGEYGVVKTNMFYMAGFSTFGLVYSSTRYISYVDTKGLEEGGRAYNSTSLQNTYHCRYTISNLTLCSLLLESSSKFLLGIANHSSFTNRDGKT